MYHTANRLHSIKFQMIDLAGLGLCVARLALIRQPKDSYAAGCTGGLARRDKLFEKSAIFKTPIVRHKATVVNPK